MDMLQNMEREEIEQIIVHFLLGIMTTEEQLRLDEWVSRSPANKAFFERICAQEVFADRYELHRDIDARKAFHAFQDRVGLFRFNGVVFWKAVKYAAMLLLPLSLGVGYGMYRAGKAQDRPYSEIVLKAMPRTDKMLATLVLDDGTNVSLNSSFTGPIWAGFSMQAVNTPAGLSYAVCQNSLPSGYNELRTPIGGEYTVTLSDGTVVHMNSGSRLRYPVAFGAASRAVSLSGEAFFQVAKDKKRPFSIQTDRLLIREYGTSFNVNSFRPDVVQVVLVEGKIGVKTPDLSREVFLKESQLAEYNRNSHRVTVKDVNVLPYIAWSDGLFVFEEQPLSDIMSTLSRWYHLNVRFQNSGIARIRFTGSLSREASFEDIVKTIQFTTDVRFHIQGNEVLIAHGNPF
jgi:transmembrane sensor